MVRSEQRGTMASAGTAIARTPWVMFPGGGGAVLNLACLDVEPLEPAGCTKRSESQAIFARRTLGVMNRGCKRRRENCKGNQPSPKSCRGNPSFHRRILAVGQQKRQILLTGTQRFSVSQRTYIYSTFHFQINFRRL